MCHHYARSEKPDFANSILVGFRAAKPANTTHGDFVATVTFSQSYHSGIGLDIAYDGTDGTLYISDDCSTTMHHHDTNGYHLSDGPNGTGDIAWAGSGYDTNGRGTNAVTSSPLKEFLKSDVPSYHGSAPLPSERDANSGQLD